ncbi:MAG: insulinase family protein [Bacteroidales bacterium]|jgi:predicted Zn-dependent peptidase|nr:insulinase family protein [Bacteroidales bacterium]
MNIPFKKHILSNGLKVIASRDTTTSLCAFNLLYDVGAKDENPEKTGFAHLFEHLMFGGSKNVKDFDEELENIGGENNAFTNNDFTDYYISVPREHIETAFRLESDRMQNLTINKTRLSVQQKVVIEEYRQRYLNQPYEDASLFLRPLTFTRHPYRWSTIGKSIEHIESITVEDVHNFYNTFYMPDNAILSVVGDIDADDVFAFAEKWFGSIPRGGRGVRSLPVEPIQVSPRLERVTRDVPANALYRNYHIGGRGEESFYVFDMISDILSNGESSRLYIELVKKERLFSDIDAYVSGDIEPGTFLISGRLNDGVSYEKACEGIERQLERVRTELVGDYELAKIKNKVETALLFSNIKALDKALNLAFFELLGGAEMIADEAKKYAAVTPLMLQQYASRHLIESNCSALEYCAASLKK